MNKNLGSFESAGEWTFTEEKGSTFEYLERKNLTDGPKIGIT